MHHHPIAAVLSRRAFMRAHAYPFNPAKVEHQKWRDGWLAGYSAGKRVKRKPKKPQVQTVYLTRAWHP